MNDIITLSQLITRLAKTTGVDNNTARRFLKAFFATVEDSLARGESVSIKNIGTFRRPADDTFDSKDELVFIPDELMMDEINRPFEMFEAVELAPDIDFDNLVQEDEPKDENKVKTVAQIPDEHETEETTSTPIQKTTYTVPQTIEETIIRPRTPLPEEPVQKKSTYTEPVKEEARPAPTPIQKATAVEFDDDERPRRNLIWLWISLAVIVFCVGGYLAAVYTTPMPEWGEDETEEEITTGSDSLVVDTVSVPSENVTSTAVAEPVKVQQAQPVNEAAPANAKETPTKKPVYDTVEVSLIRLAVKHYKEKFFWVYIYEANKDVISNPNTIRPGTKVVIPDASTFPGDNREDARRIARQKQTQILAQFEK